MDIPPVAPQSSSGGKTVLIVVIVLLVLCCLCTCLAGAGAAAYFLIVTPTNQSGAPIPEYIEPTFVFPTITVPTIEPIFPFDETPTGEAPEEEETPTPEETPETTSTPKTLATQAPAAGGTGLGVSRQEMIDFFNVGGAFTFDDPIKTQGMEIVQGEHSSLCVKTDCAAVTLGGPEDDLQVVSVVAPTGSEHGQALPAFTLLMNTAVRFIDTEKDGDIPLKIMKDLLDAVDNGKKLEKVYESNGYKLLEMYDPGTRQAGLAVTRAR